MCQLSSLRISLCRFLLGRPGRGWWAGCCPSPQILCRTREPMQSSAGGVCSLLSCTKGSLELTRTLWMAAAISLGQHSTNFSPPVLFSCVVFIYSWLLLSLQRWVLGVSLLPETWSSLKCPWVLVSVLFLSGSPGFLPLTMVIQEGIPRVLCYGHFLLNWKIIQTTQKCHKNMDWFLISYGEVL